MTPKQWRRGAYLLSTLIGFLKLQDVNFFGETIAEVSYKLSKDNFIRPQSSTNVVIASFTTAHARLKLYSVLEKLQTHAAYSDTVSVVWIEKPGNGHQNLALS